MSRNMMTVLAGSATISAVFGGILASQYLPSNLAVCLFAVSAIAVFTAVSASVITPLVAGSVFITGLMFMAFFAVGVAATSGSFVGGNAIVSIQVALLAATAIPTALIIVRKTIDNHFVDAA